MESDSDHIQEQNPDHTSQEENPDLSQEHVSNGAVDHAATPPRKREIRRGVIFANVTKAKRRKTNAYRAGALAESPLTPTAGPFSLSSSFASSHPYVSGPACTGLASLLTFVGLEDRVSYLYGHMPSATQRANPEFWREFEGERDARYAANCLEKCIHDIMERVCSSFTGNDMEKTEASAALYDKIIASHFPLVSDPHHHNLLTTIGECYTKAKLGSVERRTLRACLTTFTRREAQKLDAQVDGFTLSANGFADGRNDLKLLRSGSRLLVSPKTYERYSRHSIDKVVQFIISPDNVAFLSWGTKKLKLGGKTEIFPAIIRRRSISAMFEAYVATFDDSTISSTTFYRIAARITAGGTKLRKAVDYVVGFLVNDSFRKLKALGESLDMPSARISEDIDILSSYMKYGFDQRVKDTTCTPCQLHDIGYGLDPKKHHVGTSSICDDCTAVFHIFAKVRRLLELKGGPPETLKITDDCSEKARLFFGHRLRVINQQIAVQKLVDAMEERCVSTGISGEAIVTLDFKMKLEPLYYREKTVDHYGKRGISWHGALVHYFEFNDDIQHSRSPSATDTKIYYDHLSLDDSKQDRDSVLSLVEAVIIRLRKDLPSINCITLLSDNATCYQNWLLPLIVPYLAWIHGITIKRIIHSETQDGKSVLDAHFARAMQTLIEWVKEDHDCTTPTQAVIGLQAHGGLPNCVVELIKHDRQALQALTSQVESMEKILRSVMSRANEIEIDVDVAAERGTRNPRNAGPMSYTNCPNFSLRIYEYSCIGDGVKVLCRPCQGVCVLDERVESHEEIDEEEELDYDEWLDDNDETQTRNITPQNAKEVGRQIGVDLGSDMDESDSEDCGCETIEMDSSTGACTGVQIITQGQLRRRSRRLRQHHSVSSEDAVLKRDAVSYAMRKALTMSRAQTFLYNVLLASMIALQKQR